MKVTWNFIAALVVGFLLALGLTALAFYLNLGVHSNASKWAFEVNQKKQSLARHIPSPKLILAGGSATLFGLGLAALASPSGGGSSPRILRTVNGGVFWFQIGVDSMTPGSW